MDAFFTSPCIAIDVVNEINVKFNHARMPVRLGTGDLRRLNEDTSAHIIYQWIIYI